MGSLTTTLDTQVLGIIVIWILNLIDESYFWILIKVTVKASTLAEGSIISWCYILMIRLIDW
jgi:hypothetical protein